MKKILTILFIAIIVIAGIFFFTSSQNFMENIVKDIDVSEIKLSDIGYNSNMYYYEKLSDSQKKCYRAIAKGIMELKENITVQVTKEENYDIIKDDIDIALAALLADYPDAFYIGDKYEIGSLNIINTKILNLKLDYTSKNKAEIQNMAAKMNDELDKISSRLVDAKSNYEKELLIHDILAKDIAYYNYEDVNNIPFIKHTAYSALVDKSAVCDGMTKAFQIALNKNGIESIFVTGETEGVAHAWCKVKIDNDYYNVDLTSDKTLNAENTDLIVHSYFNVTDKEILNTHKIDKNDQLPSCTATKYNYYIFNNYTISTLDNFQYKLNQIVQKQKAEPLLEVNITGINNVPEKLVEALYNINFNRFKTNNITSMQYNKINNNYIVIK